MGGAVVLCALSAPPSFFARFSARARARASPGNGRALGRRPPLKASPGPTSKARWLAATSGDVQRGALASRTHARQASTLSCSSIISLHLSLIPFSRPVMLPLAGCSVAWKVSCIRARSHLACMAEPCASIDTPDVLERRAVGWTSLRTTRGHADTQTRGRVGERRESRTSLTDIDAVAVWLDQEFPGPSVQCVYSCRRTSEHGGGEGDNRRRQSFLPSILSTFFCSLEGCGTPVHARPAPSLGAGLPRRRKRLHIEEADAHSLCALVRT